MKKAIKLFDFVNLIEENEFFKKSNEIDLYITTKKKSAMISFLDPFDEVRVSITDKKTCILRVKNLFEAENLLEFLGFEQSADITASFWYYVRSTGALERIGNLIIASSVIK